ncbi:hypothetical protein, partial [Brucella suis]|uniref:hypothetical protein n=1 Tax=Brucella suis TaxID=29461 RepID=UPI001FB13CA0
MRADGSHCGWLSRARSAPILQGQGRPHALKRHGNIMKMRPSCYKTRLKARNNRAKRVNVTTMLIARLMLLMTEFIRADRTDYRYP